MTAASPATPVTRPRRCQATAPEVRAVLLMDVLSRSARPPTPGGPSISNRDSRRSRAQPLRAPQLAPRPLTVDRPRASLGRRAQAGVAQERKHGRDPAVEGLVAAQPEFGEDRVDVF